MTNKLIPVEFNDQRILTTEQLAEVYGTEASWYYPGSTCLVVITKGAAHE